MMKYNVQEIRQAFKALHCADSQQQLPIFFDGPGGSQVPQSVISALSDYLGCYNSNLGGYADAGVRTTQINSNAREMAGAWLGCSGSHIVFGLNSTSLMFQISRVLSNTWQAGENIVVSQIDHFSNVSSWQRAAEDKGVSVRFLPLLADGSGLDLAQLNHLIDEKTKLVAVSLASNVLGTKTDIAPIIQRAHEVGAYVAVDAVHAVVHERVNIAKLGCDMLFASSYKLGGAHLGMAYLCDEILALPPYKVEPATQLPPNAWEQGTQSFEAHAAMIALVEYWANLARFADTQPENGDLAARLDAAYQVVKQYEQSLTQFFLDNVQQRDYIQLYGKPNAQGRTPTFAFNLIKNGKIVPPSPISQWFGAKNVALPSGNFYALDVVRHLGIEDTGFLRVGFLHYTTQEEVARLFALLDEYYSELK